MACNSCADFLFVKYFAYYPIGPTTLAAQEPPITPSAGSALSVGALPTFPVDNPAANSPRPDEAGHGGHDVDFGFLFHVEMWWNELPWRPAAAWSVVAAALAAGVMPGPGNEPIWSGRWQTLILAGLLADPLWGTVWRALAGQRGAPSPRPLVKPRRPRVWLPYLQAGSPAARLLGWERPGASSTILPTALPGIVLACLVAASLGPWALLLSGVVLVLSGLGWLKRWVPVIPLALVHSLVTVGLPWALVLGMVMWNQFDGVEVVHPSYQIALLVLWTVHDWGAYRGIYRPLDPVALGLMVAAQVGQAVIIVLISAPIWLAGLALFWLPTWLAVSRQVPTYRVRFWWLAAMLISALAVGQAG